MADLSGYDAAYPPSHPPADQVVFGYLGGDTPNVWTRAEWASQPARYRVGIWTRSNPATAAQGSAEGRAAMAAWRALGAPAGTLLVLDLETAINAAYVRAFDAAVLAAGCRVAAYGSSSTLFKNPRPSGGYFPADITNKPHLYPGCLLTQYEFETGWDDDEVSASLIGSLWDTRPAPKPPTPPTAPAPTPMEDDDMMIFDAPTGATGDGRAMYLASPVGYVHIPGEPEDPGAGSYGALVAKGVPVYVIDWALQENLIKAAGDKYVP